MSLSFRKKFQLRGEGVFSLQLPGPVVLSGGMQQGSLDVQVLDGQGDTVTFPGCFCREVLQEPF